VGEPVISVDGVGIRFARGRRRQRGRRQLRTVLTGGSFSTKKQFWALRDVSFSIGQGEAVGVVGGNGQGKSTLLKIVAGVLLPDEGSVTVTQGVAPLIELTAGLSSALTARDNVYILAGLHGRSRDWVDDRFDDIATFADMPDSWDTLVRHLSSGMRVRLAFSVVTQLDEPIIMVDEALAVGDRRFRQRCYERIEQLSSEGRTLFLVSHNEKDLSRFCSRALYLRSGQLLADGPVTEVIERYVSDQERRS
jgi:ABC-2 type transport system ATP-binding protein